jgi:spermidine synthase
MIVATKGLDPISEEVSAAIRHEGDDVLSGCRYYTEDVHRSSFALPVFVRNIFQMG